MNFTNLVEDEMIPKGKRKNNPKLIKISSLLFFFLYSYIKLTAKGKTNLCSGKGKNLKIYLNAGKTGKA